MNPLWCHAGSAAVITLCHNCSVSCMQSPVTVLTHAQTIYKYAEKILYSTVPCSACLESSETIDFSFGYLYFTKENLFAWSCFKYKELTSASRSLYARAQQAWGEGAKYPRSWSWYAGPAWLSCRNILFLTPMTGIKCSSLTSIRSLFDLSSHLNILNTIPGHVNM